MAAEREASAVKTDEDNESFADRMRRKREGEPVVDLNPANLASSDHSPIRTEAEVVAAASSRGHIPIYPAPYQLFIDIDSKEGMHRHNRLWEIFLRVEPNAMRSFTPSSSRRSGHSHVTVDLGRPVGSLAERLMLQAVLGSDPVREILSWERLRSGCEEKVVSVFFEKVDDD